MEKEEYEQAVIDYEKLYKIDKSKGKIKKFIYLYDIKI